MAPDTPAPTNPITVATQSDLKTILWLQAKWKDDIGFLNRAAHGIRIGLGGTYLIAENGEPAGYVMTHPGEDGCCWVKQVAVHPDLLRSALGSQLLARIVADAQAGGLTMLRLRSRVDLPANAFWPTLGFQFVGQLFTRNRQRNTLNEWTLALTDPTARPAPPPRERKPTLPLPTERLKANRALMPRQRTILPGLGGTDW